MARTSFTLGRWLAFLVLFAASSRVFALSCYGLEDRFFLECEARECQVAFRARDIATGGCGRRTLVGDTSTDVSAAIAKQYAGSLGPGKFEVKLTHRYYGSPPESGVELSRALAGGELRAPRSSVARLSEQTQMSQLRTDWDGRARSSLLSHIANWVLEIALLVLGLLATLRTMWTYRRRLTGQVPGRVLSPLAWQFGLFVLAALVLVSSPTGPFLVGLVAPILLLVWVWEAGMFVWLSQRRRRAHEA